MNSSRHRLPATPRRDRHRTPCACSPSSCWLCCLTATSEARSASSGAERLKRFVFVHRPPHSSIPLPSIIYYVKTMSLTGWSDGGGVLPAASDDPLRALPRVRVHHGEGTPRLLRSARGRDGRAADDRFYKLCIQFVRVPLVLNVNIYI